MPPPRFVPIEMNGEKWIWDTQEDEFIPQGIFEGGDCWEDEDPDTDRPNPWET